MDICFVIGMKKFSQRCNISQCLCFKINKYFSNNPAERDVSYLIANLVQKSSNPNDEKDIISHN